MDAEDEAPNGPLVMRWRSPGSSADPGSGTDDDGSPHSLSLSVSEVQTAVLAKLKLGDLTLREVEREPMNLPAKPVIPPQPVPKHTNAVLPPKPVTKRALKRGANVKMEEAKCEQVKIEPVDTVSARERLGAPVETEVQAQSSTMEGSVCAFSREVTEGGEDDDYGVDDGDSAGGICADWHGQNTKVC